MPARSLAAAVLVAAAAFVPASAAHAVACPGASLPGTVNAGACDYVVLHRTPNTGYTVEGTVVPYCTVGTNAICYKILTEWFSEYPSLGATGVDVNGNTPPVPSYDPSTGQVSAPQGSYGTVYVDGIAIGLNTPAYCVTIKTQCP
jgi:hypothetical protein